MAVSEQERHQMHSKLETVLGEREAGILVEHLPPTGWGDVATRRDLDQLGSTLRSESRAGFAELRGEVADLRSETRTEFAQVREEIAELRSETRTELAQVREEIAELRSETRTELAEFRGEMRTALAGHRAETKADLTAVYKAMSRMTWTMTVSMIGTIVASASFAFTAGMAM